MQTIQVVIDEELLRAADRAARKKSVNRSALFRDALKEYLKKLHYQELERRDREGYKSRPDTGEMAVWEGVAAWPDE
jgi:metal-responsive CopG/Arc/MetJ family transcriptional regulator